MSENGQIWAVNSQVIQKSPLWLFLEPKTANLAIFEIQIANLAITTNNPTSKGPCVQKWTNLDSGNAQPFKEIFLISPCNLL